VSGARAEAEAKAFGFSVQTYVYHMLWRKIIKQGPVQSFVQVTSHVVHTATCSWLEENILCIDPDPQERMDHVRINLHLVLLEGKH